MVKFKEAIFEKGIVLSQFPPGTKNIKQNFIKRNELIAMLAEKVVVIQAGINSGALYTAKCGMEYNKEVFAVPNSIYDSFSLGTNDLIFKGAKIYCNSKMIVKSNAINQNSIVDLPKMNEEETEVFRIIKLQPSTLDQIKEKLKISLINVEELLLVMELKGYIKQVGGIFMSIHL